MSHNLVSVSYAIQFTTVTAAQKERPQLDRFQLPVKQRCWCVAALCAHNACGVSLVPLLWMEELEVEQCHHWYKEVLLQWRAISCCLLTFRERLLLHWIWSCAASTRCRTSSLVKSSSAVVSAVGLVERLCPATSRKPVQGVHCLSSCDSWDRLQQKFIP